MDEELLGASAHCRPADFETRIGQTFHVSTLAQPDQWFDVKLASVSLGRQSTEGYRDQFSVFFEHVDQFRLNQGQLCTIRDGDTDWLVLFLSPITNPVKADDQPQVILEAAFC